MADEIEIEGVKYISSKRASELSGYAQDYIGQLARGGYIDAKRIGGLWHVSLVSLEEYGKDAAAYKPQPPGRVQVNDPDSLISFDGKDYISAAHAARLTGYHQDYVGQLARKGAIASRQVGNRWYVGREEILVHKNEKDRLLGAVQSQSVGISQKTRESAISADVGHVNAESEQKSAAFDYGDAGTYLTYTKDSGDLMPLPYENQSTKHSRDEEVQIEPEGERHLVSIRVNRGPIRSVAYQYSGDEDEPIRRSKRAGKTIFYGTVGAAVLTVAVVLYFGYSSISKSSIYAADASGDSGISSEGLFTASATNAFAAVGDLLESLLVPELIYKRTR